MIGNSLPTLVHRMYFHVCVYVYIYYINKFWKIKFCFFMVCILFIINFFFLFNLKFIVSEIHEFHINNFFDLKKVKDEWKPLQCSGKWCHTKKIKWQKRHYPKVGCYPYIVGKKESQSDFFILWHDRSLITS